MAGLAGLAIGGISALDAKLATRIVPALERVIWFSDEPPVSIQIYGPTKKGQPKQQTLRSFDHLMVSVRTF